MSTKDAIALHRVLRRMITGMLLASMLTWSQTFAITTEPKLKVIASFSILADIAKQVAGPDVIVEVLVDRNSDTHGFEPTLCDARKLAEANMLIVNGLGFEPWLARLQQMSGFSGTVVTTSACIKARAFGGGKQVGHDHVKHADKMHANGHRNNPVSPGHDSQDPHAWQNLSNGRAYVLSIARALVRIDPANAQSYNTRAQAYIMRIDMLDAELKRNFSALPVKSRKVVTCHDTFGYFGEAYGIIFLPASGLSTSAELSAKRLANLIKRVKRENISALFLENVSSPRVIEQIARETQTKIGGTLYSDALAMQGQAATYLGMFEWNASQLLNALQ